MKPYLLRLNLLTSLVLNPPSMFPGVVTIPGPFVRNFSREGSLGPSLFGS